MTTFSRRSILGAPLGAAAVFAIPSRVLGTSAPEPDYSSFPSQDMARVRDTVRFSHFDLDKMTELVQASPALAKAAVDWGFGDWETAIGAASHMGRRDIADVLLEHGARPDLFTYVMLGDLAAVRGCVTALPGIQSTPGPHGITLLAHAKSGGEDAIEVVEYLEDLGGADPAQVSKPLELDQEAYLGTYSWGPTEAERVEIEEQDDYMGLSYRGGFGRTLFHVGDHKFFPTGAPAVRVVFQVKDGQAVSLSVADPGIILQARRS